MLEPDVKRWHLTQTSDLFDRFKTALKSASPDGIYALGSENGFTVYYVPFDYVNPEARLVLVGITPGPKQIQCSRSSARRLLSSNLSDAEVLREIKRTCAFAGKPMRPRINEMLDHFGISACIGVQSAESLWTTEFGRLHATSIIPNAAYKAGKYFNGPFSTVLGTNLLRQQFEDVFIPSIVAINRQALYLGMGPVADEGLRWCVARGVISSEQILGYFPHPSGNSGSQFAYFLRKKHLSDLAPRDPVRKRARDLDAAYERIKNSIALHSCRT